MAAWWMTPLAILICIVIAYVIMQSCSAGAQSYVIEPFAAGDSQAGPYGVSDLAYTEFAVNAQADYRLDDDMMATPMPATAPAGVAPMQKPKAKGTK